MGEGRVRGGEGVGEGRVWERGRVRERGGCGRREGVGEGEGRVRERGGCGRGVCLLLFVDFVTSIAFRFWLLAPCCFTSQACVRLGGGGGGGGGAGSS